MSELRPLTIGEVLDHSASLWRREWKALFAIGIGFHLFEYLSLKAWQLAAEALAPASLGGARFAALASDNQTQALIEMGIGIGGYVVIFVIASLVNTVSSVAVAGYLYPRIIGDTRPPDSGQALKLAIARAPSAVGAQLLAILASTLIWLIASIPGGGVLLAASASKDSRMAVILVPLGAMALVLALGAAVLWVILRALVIPQILAVEQLSAWAAFNRSRALTSGKLGNSVSDWVVGRLTVLISLTGIILFIIVNTVGAPTMVLHLIYGNILDPLRATPEAVPQLLLVPAELLQTVASALLTPVYVAMATVFYVDMRVRREGLDLALQLERPT